MNWISCAAKLPPKFEEVLIAFRDSSLPATGQYTESERDNDGWCYPSENDPDEVGPVTHWMPLPVGPWGKPATQRARKIGGSYQAEGVIVSEFKTTAGESRVVFEFDTPKGMLHIFNETQIERI